MQRTKHKNEQKPKIKRRRDNPAASVSVSSSYEQLVTAISTLHQETARRGNSKTAKTLARKSLALYPEPWLFHKANLLLPETLRPARLPQQ